MHRRLLLLTRTTRLPLLLTVLSGVLAGFLTIGQSYALSSMISDVFLGNKTLAGVWPWMEALAAIIIGRALLGWLNEVVANAVAVRIKTQLRDKLFAHILALGPAYTRGERTGDLTAAAVDGIEALDAYFSQYLPQLVISTLVPVSILLLVFPLDLLSGIVLLVTAPLIPFFMFMIGRGAEAVTKRQYETLSRLSAHFLDSLQGLTTLKLFGQSKAQGRNIAAVSDEYRDTTLKVLQVTFLSALALELLATISTAIIAVEVGLRLLYGRMQFQEALFLLILAPEFYLPLRMLGLRFHAGMAGTSAGRRIFEILDTGGRIPGDGGAREGRTSEAAQGYLEFSTLELDGVSYTYPGESEAALTDVSMKIEAGQHVALVGASGAGKSTLASLLLRFMVPECGAMRLNGKPLEDIPVDEWRGMIAWVPQRPHLFHDSIAANIRLGNPEASDEEIAAAARAAHLEAFIESLPKRYETQIAEGGARLSSGQAQRLALARAFLRNAPVLILDEPTSRLDPETESLLEESTRTLMQGRTVITIAHRLNTVKGADEILVLERGRVIEAGTHATLMQKDGAYARTVNTLAPHEALPEAGQAAALQAEAARPVGDARLARPEILAIDQPTDRREQAVFFRLLSFLRGSWGWVALSVLLGSATIGAGVALMGTSSWLISTAALHPSIAALEVAIVGVRFFGIVRAVLRYLERLISHSVTFRLLGRLRVWFYEKLEPLAPARLMEYRAGDLLARVISDVNTLENFYVRVLAPPVTAIVVCTGTAIFLAANDARLAAVLVACFLLLGAALPLAVQVMNERSGAEAIARRAELQSQLVDGIQGLPDIVAFGRGQQRIEQLRGTGAEYGAAQRRSAWVSGVHTAAYALITNFAAWLVLLIAIPEVAAGRMSGVMLAPLVLVTAAAFEAVAPLPLAAQTWSATRAAARRLFAVVDTEPTVRTETKERGNANQVPEEAMSIEFAGVWFCYPGEMTPALEDICFRVEAGQKIAIVGASGAGKSTLANLLLRFWEYERGEIRLGGRSIREHAPDEVRARVVVVPPNTYFFNTSVYENLRMARRGVTRQEVEEAARAAQIHNVIVKLPKGYDTLIGEQGTRLSGGERQRLAIARALVKNGPVLLLDEPTANLDAQNEAEILETLLRVTVNKSTLLITHRLIGLDRMDEILVMDHGRIVERGRQADLLRNGGAYRRLWDLQNAFLLEPSVQGGGESP